MTEQTKFIKLVYLATARTPDETYSFGVYNFTYDGNLRPIPVLVDEVTAAILLNMEEKPCDCHYRNPKKLFALAD